MQGNTAQMRHRYDVKMGPYLMMLVSSFLKYPSNHRYPTIPLHFNPKASSLTPN